MKSVPRAGAAQAARSASAKKEWTLQDAMPENSPSMRHLDPPPAQPKIGRLPLQSGPGTVGFETETRSNGYQTPDGRTIPGLQATENKSSSYLGLSLSVPTSDKGMGFPVPLAPPTRP